MHGIIRVKLIHFTTLKILCFGNMEFACHNICKNIQKPDKCDIIRLSIY